MHRIDHRDLLGEQLTLSPLNLNNYSNDYVDWLNDPDVNRYLEIRHNVPFTKDDVIKFVEMCNKISRYHWGIMYKKKHIGNISCSIVDKRYKFVNISNLIGVKKYWNSDMCKLSLNAAMHYLFCNAHYNRIEAGTYSIHLSGITLLTNLGFKKEMQKNLNGISINELKNLSNNKEVLLIDLREKVEIEKKPSLSNSVNIPYSSLQEHLNKEKKILSYKTIIFYCAVGERSALAIQMCKTYKFENAFHLIGGINNI